jgi:hypothetical protein
MKQNHYQGIMREIIKKYHDKSRISDRFQIGNIETNNPTDIANGFCDYFTNVGPKLSGQIPSSRKSYNN